MPPPLTTAAPVARPRRRAPPAVSPAPSTTLPAVPGVPLFLRRPDEALRDGERRGRELRRPEVAAETFASCGPESEEPRTPSPEACTVADAMTPPESGDLFSSDTPAASGTDPAIADDPAASASEPVSTPDTAADPPLLYTPAAEPGDTTTSPAPEEESVSTEAPLNPADVTSAGDGGVDGGETTDAGPPATTDAEPTEEPTEPAPDGRAGPGPEGAADGADAAALDTASMDELAAGDLDLIDTELAEHQRWRGAADTVGAAGSADRAAFVLNQIREGLTTGAAGGVGMGLSLGLLHRGLGSQLAARLGTRLAARMSSRALAPTAEAAAAAARFAGRLGSRIGPRVAAQTARFTPLPAIGAVIGGVISFHSLYTRDWRQTRQTLANFGEGGSKYERLANSIAAISEVVDILSNGLNVLAGIMGAITVGLWIAAVASAGALSPLAGTLTAISLAIGVVTLALDAINMLVLQPAVTLFRALHAFTSESDPREVVADGQALSAAAANNGGAIGGLLGARGANIGHGPPNPHASESTRHSEDTPPPAAGAGPRVDFEARPTPPDAPAPTPAPATHPSPEVGTTAPASSPTTPHPAAEVPTTPVTSPRPAAEPPVPAVTPEAPRPNPPAPDTTPARPAAPAATPTTGRPPPPSPEHHWVEGYTRADGTPVAGHWRGPRRSTSARPPASAEPATPARTTAPESAPASGRPPQPSPEHHWVEGYTRADGTTVAGHWRGPRRSASGAGRGGSGGTSSGGSGGGGGGGGRRRSRSAPATPLTPDQIADAVEAAGRRSRADAIRREGRSVAEANLRESTESGIYDPQSAQTVDDLGRGRVDEILNTPADPDGDPRPGSRAEGRSTSVEFSDLERLADRPLEGSSGSRSHLTDYNEHRRGHHGGDTRQPIELGEPRDPDWNRTEEPARDFTSDPDAARRSALDPEAPMDDDFAESPGWQTEESRLQPEDDFEGAADFPDPRVRARILAAQAEFRARQRGGGSGSGSPPASPVPAAPPSPATPTAITEPVPAASTPPPTSVSPAESTPATPLPGAPAPAPVDTVAPPTVTPAGPATPVTEPGTAAISPERLERERILGLATSASTASSSGRPAPGSDPSLLQTFFPIFYAGAHGPSPEEQQATFNAQFASDFPPVPGEERANPAYTDPPCTPAQIAAIRGHIEELRQARAQTTTAEARMDAEIATHTANEAPLLECVDTTSAGVEATTQHDEKVQATSEANASQQERQDEVSETVSQYDDHSGAIDGLRTPLRAFQGMMDLASYLPGDAGAAMADMNRDATSMLASFDEMDATMASQQEGSETCAEQLQSEGAQITEAGTDATATGETMSTANTDALALQERNDAAVTDATERRDAASEATSTIDGNIEEQETRADTLAQQLQAWAADHSAARQAALATTEARVEGLGLTVTATHER